MNKFLILKIEMELIISYMVLIFVQKEEFQIGKIAIIYIAYLIELQYYILIKLDHALQIANYVMVEVVLLVKKDILYLVQLVKEM